MQYQVPQFLDVEDKIAGPFTFKQLIYLGGGAGLLYLSIRYIPFVGWLVGFALLGFGVALAFYRPNNRPFVVRLEAMFNYFRSHRLYLWRRREAKAETTVNNLVSTASSVRGLGIPVSGGSKLNEMTWAIDIKKEGDVEAEKVRGDNAA